MMFISARIGDIDAIAEFSRTELRLGRYARAFNLVLLWKSMQNPRIRSVRLNLSKTLTKDRFELGMGIHLPAYVTKVKDAGLSCANVCGLNIPRKPMK